MKLLVSNRVETNYEIALLISVSYTHLDVYKRQEIGEIETGCGCTQASVEKYELNPDESCSLHFSFNPKGKGLGAKEELIIINANTDSLFYILQVKAIIQ